MLLLTDEEIAAITHRVKPKAQSAVLIHLGVPFKITKDGFLVVLRKAAEAALGYAQTNEGQASPRVRIPEARRLLSRQKGKVD